MGQIIPFPLKTKPIDTFELGQQSLDTRELRRMSLSELCDELAYVANYVSACQFFINAADTFKQYTNHEVSQHLGNSSIQKMRFEQTGAESFGGLIQREINNRETGDHAA